MLKIKTQTAEALEIRDALDTVHVLNIISQGIVLIFSFLILWSRFSTLVIDREMDKLEVVHWTSFFDTYRETHSLKDVQMAFPGKWGDSATATYLLVKHDIESPPAQNGVGKLSGYIDSYRNGYLTTPFIFPDMYASKDGNLIRQIRDGSIKIDVINQYLIKRFTVPYKGSHEDSIEVEDVIHLVRDDGSKIDAINQFLSDPTSTRYVGTFCDDVVGARLEVLILICVIIPIVDILFRGAVIRADKVKKMLYVSQLKKWVIPSRMELPFSEIEKIQLVERNSSWSWWKKINQSNDIFEIITKDGRKLIISSRDRSATHFDSNESIAKTLNTFIGVIPEAVR